jgi:hypothetical protein
MPPAAEGALRELRALVDGKGQSHAAVDAGSKPGAGGAHQAGKRKEPEGTVMGWGPKCGAEGGEGEEHNQPMQWGKKLRYCGAYSLSFAQPRSCPWAQLSGLKIRQA